MPLPSTRTAPSFAVVPVFTTGVALPATVVAELEFAGCAPGETVAFADDPHAASASTAAAPTTIGAIRRFINVFVLIFVVIVIVLLPFVGKPGVASSTTRDTAHAHFRFTTFDRAAGPSIARMESVRLLLVSGSLQRVSANRALLDAAARCVHDSARLTWFDGIAEIPHFNPELTNDLAPVVAWRDAVADADGVLIASPEYAHSLPGSLKNALDWLVGSGELYEKPVGLMSAGTSGGQRALDALAQTLRAQGANIVGRLEVAGVRPKLDAGGNIADPETLAQTCALVTDLAQAARR
jgi:chromate reductase, NAD(P)H dehydrogenase (quinone)